LLALIEVITPDIIFLDINMPGFNGIECLKLLRSKDRYKTWPIIMYTTSTNKLNIEASYKNGANYYFPKPTKMEKLINALNGLLRKNWQVDAFPRSIKDFVIG
jgi:DNA-binding response OmpR family regulator